MNLSTIVRIYAVAIAISLAVSFGAWQAFRLMIRLMDESHLARQQLEVGSQLSEFRLQLEQHLNTTFYLTRGFATLVDLGMLREPDFRRLWSENFQPWAEKTHEQMPFIRNIGFAEKYTITHVYPPEDNQAAVGVDYRDVDWQWPAVAETIASGQPTVAGPMRLIQGGTGLVFRTPFYSRNSDGREDYVGMALMVLDLPELLDAAGIQQAHQQLALALRESHSGEVFFGDADLFADGKGIHQPVVFMGGQWQLTAAPLNGWQTRSPQSRSLSFLFIIMTAFIATAVFVAVLSVRSLLAHTLLLEQKVAQRTGLLQQAKEQAEQANRIKTTFFASITHDLRTPLNSIIGLSQLVMDMELGDKQREYIRKSLTSANLLLVLINDILSYSKIESGKESLHNAPFSLRQLLHKLDDLFAIAAQTKQLRFEIDCDDDLPPVWSGDQDKLLQILANLCANALKFTEQGEIRVHAGWCNADTRSQLCISVSDTGVGIAESDLPLLFEPFMQFGNATRPYTTSGTGLGLSICQRLTEIMGGSIDVTSKPGQGSRFVLTLPLTPLSGNELPDHGSGPITAPESLRGYKVILAEDNAFNQLLATRLLEKAGITTLLADNGEQVLQLLKKHSVDGILMDIQMPLMDGIEAARKIRQDSRFAKLPIIAMTANASEEDRQQAINAGMNDFVSKPIDVARLYRVLEQWLATDKP